MKQTRREFIASTTAAGMVLAADPRFIFKEPEQIGEPWYNTMRRCAQHNLNEYDPVILDVNAWVDYWADLKLDALVITAGGFLAMYPTLLPYHKKSQFLGDRDLFGEYSKACKKKGIRVVARIETNWAHEEIFKARPEWFERNSDGTPRPNPETPWVYRTCLFSDYRNEQIPKIARELIAMYDVDGIFTNSWPDAGRPYLCNCENCRKEGPLKGKELHERFLNRKLEICGILNSVVKEKRKDCVYNVNIAGSIGAVQNLKKIGDLAEWVNADHQGRGGNTPVWDCSLQGRVAYSIMKGKPVTNAVGTKTGPWRHSTNSEAEIILWLAQTVSSGMIPWLIWLGAELPDRRWRSIGQKYYNWLAENEKHFINKRSLAKVGVVFSQRLNEYYNAPGRIPAGYGSVAGEPVGKGNPTDYLQGMYYALLEGRFLFDLVHETDLKQETLKQYSALILPNTALLDDEQVRVLHDYVNSGGSLLATFETGLYDEWGGHRKTHALGDIFDVAIRKDYQGPAGQIFYMAIDRKHEIVEGFGDTDQLPGGEYRVPLDAPGEHVLTIIPPYPNGIPEMVYPYRRKEMDYPGKKSNEPGIIIREKGQSRLVYLPADIDRNLWIQGSTDLSKLLQQSISWMIKGKSPVTVKGEGNIEIFAWETQAGYALHILNYNNPNMTLASIRKFYPIGEQVVRMELPAGVKILKGELLRAGKQLSYKQEGSILDFIIPSVEDFEVVALYKS
jgi:hypothetical protein